MEGTVAVDLDGTIIDMGLEEWVKLGRRIDVFGKVVDGAVEVLSMLHDLGYRIIIHTCRVTEAFYSQYGYNKAQAVELVSNILKKLGVPFDEIWAKEGKPVADYYIDDRAIKFESWKQVLCDLSDLVKKEKGENALTSHDFFKEIKEIK